MWQKEEHKSGKTTSVRRGIRSVFGLSANIAKSNTLISRVITLAKNAISAHLLVMRVFGLSFWIPLNLMPTRVYDNLVRQNRFTTSDMSPVTLNVPHILKLVGMLEKEMPKVRTLSKNGRYFVPPLEINVLTVKNERSLPKTTSFLLRKEALIGYKTFNHSVGIVTVGSGAS